VVEQPRCSGVAATGDARKGRPQRGGIERVEEKNYQIPRRIVRDARVAVMQANVVAAQRVLASYREVFFCDFVKGSRDLNADNLFERVLRREDHRAAHAGAYVDEGCARDRIFWHEREQRAKVGNGYGLVMGSMRTGVTNGIGIEIGDPEHGVRGNAVFTIEATPSTARLSHA
jgi:hypothetical protein